MKITLNPAMEAMALYLKYPQPRTFDDDLMAHLVTGYVISTPDSFIMGRPVDRFASWDKITNPYSKFSKDEANTWLVHIFVGSRRNMLDTLPFPLQWVGWSRRNRPIKYYDFNSLLKHLRSL